MRVITLLFVLLLPWSVRSQVSEEDRWVDSVFNSLTVSQRIAQLMILRAYSTKDSLYNDSLASAVRVLNPGGICFFKGAPVQQARFTNRLQDSVTVPMLVAIDAEWGLGMRLDSCLSYPRQMALGAIQNDTLIYSMGRQIAFDCRRIGVHINFAPVVDVNNNPANPVIGFRSFGEDPVKVARKGALYMKGMQDHGLMTAAKHFPGHGDTDTDSHYDLPVITHGMGRLDSVELYPFRQLIKQGLGGIMIAHLYLPGFDTALNTPATLSYAIITRLLKEQLGFRGLVYTDALDMQGVTKFFKPGEIELKALQAGNDVLLLPKDAKVAVPFLKTAIDSGLLDSSLVAEKCRNILRIKYRLGLHHRIPIITDSLFSDLNKPADMALIASLVKESMTLVRNDIRIIPLRGLERRKIAALSLGDTTNNDFLRTLKQYGPLDAFSLAKSADKRMTDSLAGVLFKYDIVVAGVHRVTSNMAEGYGITAAMSQLLDTLLNHQRTILVLFGTPYALQRINHAPKAEAVIVAYQDNTDTEMAAASAVFGGIPINGRLPVTVDGFKAGSGEDIDKTSLEYVIPEEIGLRATDLDKVDSIVMAGIKAHAYPGCQVLLAKDGRIFYQKTFGTVAYNDTTPVNENHLYDIASVTKVAATTLAIMKLTDEKKCSLDDTLGKFLPELRGSNKAPLTIRSVMAHQAGLKDWIPFYKELIRSGKPDPEFFRTDSAADFSIKVAGNLYLRNDYPAVIIRSIADSPLSAEKGYRYSDLGFYLLKMVIERISGQTFENYLDDQFYKPLGLQHTAFNPLGRFSAGEVIPTEMDTEFRQQLIRGYVHDPGAAMMGGISGHAGLFSNSFDLAVIMQLLVQKGVYGGRQYFSEATFEEFTRYQYPGSGNRRGAGFDKPLLHYKSNGPACAQASYDSFGHSGFTGTYVWADPCNNLIYIFLSNRINPSAANPKLSEMNIRTNIHQSVYEILKKNQVK